jgi:hypothetical protein
MLDSQEPKEACSLLPQSFFKYGSFPSSPVALDVPFWNSRYTMRFTNLLLAGLSATAVVAVPSNSHVIHEKRSETPRNWKRVARLDADVVLPMRFGLTQSNLDKGHDLLMEV